MSSSIKVGIWSQYRLRLLKGGDRVLIILPLEPGEGQRLAIHEKVQINLCKNRGSGASIQAVVVAQEQRMPIGLITDDRWILHLGPGEMELVIEEVKKQYKLNDFDRFSFIRAIEVRITSIEKFL